MSGAEAVICGRRQSQLAVTIAGGAEGGFVVGTYRSHGSVLPVRMMAYPLRMGDCGLCPRYEAGQNREQEILLISIAVGVPLNHSDLVVQ